MSPEERIIESDWYIFSLLLLVCSFIASVRYLRPGHLKILAEGLIYRGKFHQMINDDTVSVTRTSQRMLMAYYLCSAALFSQCFYWIAPNALHPGLMILLVSGGFGLLHLYWTYSNHLLRHLTSSSHELHTHQRVMNSVKQLSTLVLLPLASIMAFAPIPEGTQILTAYISISLWALFFAIALVRSSLAVKKEGVHWIYIILYLCTLETSPFIVAIGLFTA